MSGHESSVERLYVRLREMAVNFDFKPESRLNESALAVELGASRTPLREALNRLVAEGLLTFRKGRGFFCRPLSPARIQELYEARAAIETEALLHTLERAADDEIATLAEYLDSVETTYDTREDLRELLAMDEEFHFRLAELANNGELLRMLANIHDRIRYVRMVNLQMLRSRSAGSPSGGAHLSAHRVIVDALVKRDSQAAIAALRSHIERRREQTVELVRVAYSQLYVPQD